MQQTDIHPQDAKKLLDEKRGYVYLDVRTPAEFEAGHVPGAINVSFADMHAGTGKMEVRPDFLPQTKVRIPRDAKVIVGCRSGGRSARACEVLRREGYTNVLNMVGGFGGVVGPGGNVEEPGWTTLGYPVEKGPESPAAKSESR